MLEEILTAHECSHILNAVYWEMLWLIWCSYLNKFAIVRLLYIIFIFLMGCMSWFWAALVVLITSSPCFHSHVNTLYLQLQCMAVRPVLMVTSNNRSNIVDFDRVILGGLHLPKRETCVCFLSLPDFVTFTCRRKNYQEDDSSEHLPRFFRCILNTVVEEYSPDKYTFYTLWCMCFL